MLVAAISGGMVFPPMMGAVVVCHIPFHVSSCFPHLIKQPITDTSQRPYRHGHPHDGIHSRVGLPDLREYLQEG